MRNLMLALMVTGAVLGVPAVPALANIPTTQMLPPAACNHGTMNAHMHIPTVPGNAMNPNLSRFGNQTNAHNAVPGTVNVMPCGHGG